MLPDVIVVFAAGVLDVISEVPTGFVVFHVAYTVQPLPPDGMMHEYAESVRVPVGGGVDTVKLKVPEVCKSGLVTETIQVPPSLASSN
jgi:anaerobic glycerol-3-phosphate dehydrogenase